MARPPLTPGVPAVRGSLRSPRVEIGRLFRPRSKKTAAEIGGAIKAGDLGFDCVAGRKGWAATAVSSFSKACRALPKIGRADQQVVGSPEVGRRH